MRPSFSFASRFGGVIGLLVVLSFCADTRGLLVSAAIGTWESRDPSWVHKCQSNADCQYTGCNDVPCDIPHAPNCNNGVWDTFCHDGSGDRTMGGQCDYGYEHDPQLEWQCPDPPAPTATTTPAPAPRSPPAASTCNAGLIWSPQDGKCVHACTHAGVLAKMQQDSPLSSSTTAIAAFYFSHSSTYGCRYLWGPSSFAARKM